MKNLKNFLVSVASVIALSVSVNAQNAEPIVMENDFEVNLVQVEEGYLYFQIGYNNNNSYPGFFEIRDAEEGELYKDLSRKPWNLKTFMIERRDGQVLLFTMKTEHKINTKQFTMQKYTSESAEFTEKEIAQK